MLESHRTSEKTNEICLKTKIEAKISLAFIVCRLHEFLNTCHKSGL